MDIKKITPYDIAAIALLLVNIAVGIAALPYMPATVPSHWDFNGNVNGYSTPETVAIWMPLFYVAMYIIIAIVPFIDPKRNYNTFSKYYALIKLALVAFLSLIHWLIIAVTLGVSVNIGIAVPIMIGILFVLLGILMPNIKQNYFIGFRTPWAIENELVWEKTQKAGGISFIIGGIAMVVFSLLQLSYLLIAAIALMVIYPFVYSYVIYRGEKK